MKKILSFVLVCAFAVTANAIPARPVWRTVSQPDGTTVEVKTVGDEYYHYIINRDGQRMRMNEDGTYEVMTEQEIAAAAPSRLASRKARKAGDTFGITPNFAEKGLVILVNFKDQSMKSSNNVAKFDNLLNAADGECTANAGRPSAAQYFSDQSYGTFNPKFDIYGPVTLGQKTSYYGGNDYSGNDQYATDAVIEACRALNTSIDFSQYDCDKDGYVDVVFVIYAGNGEADSDDSNTIWPHNWSIKELFDDYPSATKYKRADSKLDNVYLNNYVVAPELDGSGDLEGIGTVCHEFGHALGLPDFYETEYGENYRDAVTPNEWDVMDGGAYNGNGHCPPNYSPWERYFFGWQTPVNLGNEGKVLELKANGTEGYQCYQINNSGKQQTATTSGECYYIENRQAQGWDAPNYNQTAWNTNAPNNDKTSGSPLYTIASSYGTQIGYAYDEWYYDYSNQQYKPYTDTGHDCAPHNTYPGTKKVTTKTIAGKPLKSITEKNGVISLIYIEEPVIPVEPFEVVFMANGEEYAVTSSTGKLVLPDLAPEACTNGRKFVGWCSIADYESEKTAPTFARAGDEVAEGAKFYAVFASQGEGEVEVTDKLTSAGFGVTGKNYVTWANKNFMSDAVYAGKSAATGGTIQLRVQDKNEGIITTSSGGKVTKIEVEWNETSTSNRALNVFGKNTAYSSAEDLFNAEDASISGTKIGSIAFGTTTLNVSGDYTYIGMRSKTFTMYVNSISVTWKTYGKAYVNYSTECGGDETDFEIVDSQKSKVESRKMLLNGRLVIVRGDAIYSITGTRIQ